MNLVIKDTKINHDVCGLFHFVNTMAASIWVNRNTDNKLFYDIVGNSPYYDKTLEETDNVWEYYFEQPCQIKYSEIEGPTRYGNWSSFNGGHNFVTQYHLLPKLIKDKKEELQTVSNVIFNGKNRIILRQDMKDKIEEVKNRLGLKNNKYISVHYRSFIFDLNKIHNPHQSNKVEYVNWFNEIDKVLTDEHKIFLATDDDEVLENFKKKYGDRLVYNNNVDRTCDGSVGDNPFKLPNHLLWHYKSLTLSVNRKQSPYEMGVQALIDSYLLSGGDVIIRPNSGLSFFSVLLNPNIEVINIDKIY